MGLEIKEGQPLFLSSDGSLVPYKKFCKNKCSNCGKFCSFIDSGFFQDTACCGVRRTEQPIQYAMGYALNDAKKDETVWIKLYV